MIIGFIVAPLPANALILNLFGGGALSGTVLKVAEAAGVDPTEPISREIVEIVCKSSSRTGPRRPIGCQAIVRIIVGEIVKFVVDPTPAGYISSGTFQIDYPNELLDYDSSGTGWLGSWGQDPTLATISADPDAELLGTSFFVQQPNPALLGTVLPSQGMLRVRYDWGIPGLEVTGEPFNLFVASFTARRDLFITSAGDFGNNATNAAGNLGVVNTGNICYSSAFPASLDTIDCGGEFTTDKYLVDVPGPLPILGATAAFGYSRRLRKSIKASKPEVISTAAL
jgi:hypothetical protein